VHIPVTVKHRAGWDERHLNAPEFSCALAEAGAAMITVHGRTRAQGFSGKADLEVIRRVRQALPARIPVIGNGDVVDLDGYRRMRDVTGCDGVMIGRGALGNPWIFRSIGAILAGRSDPGAPSQEERRRRFHRHVELILQLRGPRRHVTEVRKACAWYSRNQANGASFRDLVFKTKDLGVLLDAARTYFAGLR
jgi:nifR3 family TIM-barrel protein